MTFPTVADRLDDYESAVEAGHRKLDWARSHMPILAELRDSFRAEQPFAGERVGMARHIEAKTAILTELIAEGGAEVAITGCNPLSTQDDVSAALDDHDDITSYARHGVDDEEYYDAMSAVLDHDPTVTVDDGCDLVTLVHEERPDLIDTILGGCEETTTVLPAKERLVVIARLARTDSPVPWTLSNSRFIGVSLTANIG